MARVAGEGSEVVELSKKLVQSLQQIKTLNGNGKKLVDSLAATSKDKSLDTAQGIVNEVASIVMKGLPACAETASKVKAYGEFLISIENG